MMMIGVRHLVLLLLLLSSITIFITRTNLNIAIVPMTSHATITHTVNSSLNLRTEQVHYGCPVKHSSAKNASNTAPITSMQSSPSPSVPNSKTYDWDQVTQGKILGSFFYSYILFQIPGGRIAEMFGSRWIIFSTLLGPGIASLIVPSITDYHYMLLMASRFLLGVFQSSFFPSAYGMICCWFPPAERSFAFAVLDIGACLGANITYAAAGYIINTMGWEYLFYFPSVIALVVSALFVTATRDQPEQHPLTSQQEIKVIRVDTCASEDAENKNNNNNNNNTSKSHDKPVTSAPSQPSPAWLSILSNPAVLATMLFKFSCQFGFSFVYLELPKYLSEVAHEEITDNGNINAAVNMLAVISMITCGFLSEAVIQRGWLSRTGTRKAFSLLVGIGTASCFALVPVFVCQSYVLYTLLCLSTFFAGCYTGSDGPIVAEMTVNFPASLYALFNMVAMSTGFIVPYFVGVVLDSYTDPTEGWSIVFYSCSGLIVVANVIFLMFADARRQDFDTCHESRVVVIEKSIRQDPIDAAPDGV